MKIPFLPIFLPLRLYLAVLCISICTCLPQQVSAAVNFPVVEGGFRIRLNALPHDSYVGSENVYLYDEEFIAINNSRLPQKAELFKIEIRPVLDEDYFYEAVLRVHGNSAAAPVIGTTDFGMDSDPDNGIYATWGWTTWQNMKLFFYTETNEVPDMDTGEVNYETFTIVTWGNGADIDNPGEAVDRAQYATIPGERKRYGMQLESVNLLQHVPGLRCTQLVVSWDMEVDFSQFIIQASPDMKSWKTVNTFVNHDEKSIFYDKYYLAYETVHIDMTDASGKTDFGPQCFYRIALKP